MRTLFAEFTVMADKKIEGVMQEPLVSRLGYCKFIFILYIIVTHRLSVEMKNESKYSM